MVLSQLMQKSHSKQSIPTQDIKKKRHHSRLRMRGCYFHETITRTYKKFVPNTIFQWERQNAIFLNWRHS